MNLLTLDFETFYGKDYTLSRLTNEEYIRDARFKAHGVGLKLNDLPAKYFYEDIAGTLAKIPWHKVCVLSHHAHFDMAILSWVYGYQPKFILDTLSMFRALYPWESASLSNMSKVLGTGEKGLELVQSKDKWELTEEEQRVLGGYCCNDVELTHAAFEKMKTGFPLDELRLIDLTVRMFSEPVCVLDADLLQEEIEAEQKRKEELLAKVAHDKKALMSNDQFAEILISLGIDPPKKLSPSKVKDGRVNPDVVGDPPVGILPSFKAQKGMTAEEKATLKEQKNFYPWSYAFGKGDEEFKLMLDHEDPTVAALVEARMGVKSTINETRAGRMLGISDRGTWPVYLTYCAATTFRFGGGDKMNPQNFTRGGRLRRSIQAPDGHLLPVADLSQIEARVLAVLAGQADVAEKFARGADIYCEDASTIFGETVTKADKDKRFLGKAVRLGCGYGLGWAKFSNMVRIGMLGNEGVLFGREMADTLGVYVDVFTARHYAKALESRPSNLTEDEHLLHCACAKEIIDRYRQANSAITNFWRQCHGIIPAMASHEDWGYEIGVEPTLKVVPKGIVMPNGLTMHYHGLKQHDGGEWSLAKRRGRKLERSKVYGGLIVENLTQCLARIVITEAILRMVSVKVRPILQVHDEVVAVAPEQIAEQTYQTMIDCMVVRPKWMPSLPLAAEGGVDKRYVK